MRDTKTPGAAARKNGLANIMKLVIAVVFSLTVALLNLTEQPKPNPVAVELSKKVSAAAPAETKPKQETPAEPAAPTVRPFDANDPTTWPTCAPGEIVRADNGQCDKAAAPEPAAVAASGAVTAAGVGDCAAEITKYNWNVSVATAVARAESGLNAGSLNNNPSTGDYSVGCFQVNLYGANARTRPSEAALKNAAVNVEWAYNNYVANGHSFIGQWGVCRSKVQCY